MRGNSLIIYILNSDCYLFLNLIFHKFGQTDHFKNKLAGAVYSAWAAYPKWWAWKPEVQIRLSTLFLCSFLKITT